MSVSAQQSALKIKSNEKKKSKKLIFTINLLGCINLYQKFKFHEFKRVAIFYLHIPINSNKIKSFTFYSSANGSTYHTFCFFFFWRETTKRNITFQFKKRVKPLLTAQSSP